MGYFKMEWIICLFAMAAGVDSRTTEVYCVHPQDSSAWYWLADGVYRISGADKYYRYQGRFRRGFSVTSKDYQAAKDACIAGWYPEPADSRFSDWRLFLVENETQDWLLAPGFVTKDHFMLEMLSPSKELNPYVTCVRNKAVTYRMRTLLKCHISQMMILNYPRLG